MKERKKEKGGGGMSGGKIERKILGEEARECYLWDD